MIKRYFELIIALNMTCNICISQSNNPFQSLGKETKVVAAYNDQFVEDFDKDSIQRIGTVLVNIHTKKIVRLLNDDLLDSKYVDNSTSSRWYSVDPLAAKGKNISYSPYTYVFDNPILYNDPDGRNGVQVIDDKNKTITIVAVYFVQTKPAFEGDPIAGYSSKDVVSMNKTINETLNKLGLSVSEGDHKGYKVSFDLTFKDGGSLADSKKAASDEKMNGIAVGNTFTAGSGDISYFKPKIVDAETGETQTVGGVTESHQNTTMNETEDNRRNKIHEIFHTLFFDQDKAKKGIGSYGTSQMPNQADINTLVNNPTLQQINTTPPAATTTTTPQ
jgi:hypothetical protein